MVREPARGPDVITTGHMRAVRGELQQAARRGPLTRGEPDGAPLDAGYFRRIDRETTWGLTLNK